jgi:hypothetical protein
MENPIIEDGYKKARRKAEEIYARIGRVSCPALGESVDFNRVGFQHLIQKRRKFRQKGEQKKRFALLQYVEDMLKNYHGEIAYEKRKISQHIRVNGKKVIVGSAAHFWALTDQRDGKTIKLIVRQLDGQGKHFFSIFEGNKKPTRKE